MSSTSETTPAPPAEDGPAQEVTPQQERTLKMLGLWEATRAGLQVRLEDDEDGELSASFFNTAVRFLEASGISAQTAIEAKDALEALRMAELVQSIVDLDKPDDPQPSPKKAGKGTTEVVPLNTPFTPRPLR